MMTAFSAGRPNDGIILVARILLVTLFLVFGWDKLINYSGALAYMAQVGAPLPALAVLVAIVMEVGVAFTLAVGLWTGPLAILLAVYTLGTGIIGHPFWAGEGAARYMDAINFYKNISIIGGCLLLYVTGPGRYSVDARLGRLRTNLGAGAARG
jgi:putative oxidoreductase